ncbi:MAG: hypothetical protein ABSF22_18650 [Bryobacteraceae bacterium]
MTGEKLPIGELMAARCCTVSRRAFSSGSGSRAATRRFTDRLRFSAASRRVFMMMMRLRCCRGRQDQRSENKNQQKDAFGHNRHLWGKNIIA